MDLKYKKIHIVLSRKFSSIDVLNFWKVFDWNFSHISVMLNEVPFSNSIKIFYIQEHFNELHRVKSQEKKVPLWIWTSTLTMQFYALWIFAIPFMVRNGILGQHPSPPIPPHQANQPTQLNQPTQSARKVVILSEIRNSGERFIELRSIEENAALEGYQLVVLDYSFDRTSGSGRVFRVKAATNLSGKSLKGFYGFVGKLCILHW